MSEDGRAETSGGKPKRSRWFYRFQGFAWFAAIIAFHEARVAWGWLAAIGVGIALGLLLIVLDRHGRHRI